jgi:integrase/recombinase XerC
MKYELVEDSPAKLVTVPKIRKKLPVFVQEENLNNLLDFDMFEKDYEGTRDKTIISLLYGAGIRLSELKNLEISNLDMTEHTIKVVGKRNKERIIPYPSSIEIQLGIFTNL